MSCTPYLILGNKLDKVVFRILLYGVGVMFVFGFEKASLMHPGGRTQSVHSIHGDAGGR